MARRRFAAACLYTAILTGCVHPEVRPAPPPAPTPIRPAMIEEGLPADARARIEIIDFQDRPTADKTKVSVSGTLINRGHASTLELRVKITACDKDDNVIDVVEAVPNNDLVPPGGTAKFSATLPNHPEVVRYQVQAYAR